MRRASKFLLLLRTPFCPIQSRVARISGISHSILFSANNHPLYSNSRSLLGFSIKGLELIHTQTASATEEDYYADPSGLSQHSRIKHPWPEWSKLLQRLGECGYFDRQRSLTHQDDGFLMSENLPEEFLRAAGACLSFAQDRPDLLRSLSWRDIENVVDNGSPFLFRNAVDSARRMKSFLGGYRSNELKFERACTVDLIHFLLSYVCKPSSTFNESGHSNKAVVESSVRNLLTELTTASRNVVHLDGSGSKATQIPDGYEQIPSGKKIEMKKGDWVCPRCSFMNFARNMKCRECDEGRPKRELSGGDWECPQCCFFNYARNALCLRCNCKRPGEASFETSGLRSGTGCISGSSPNKAEIESMLAANEEKAERWFSKVSELDTASDLSSSIADEDFPEIMPLRKGVSRFVMSARKTPLERRLANAQYRRNLGNDGTPSGMCFPAAGNGVGPDKTAETSITQTLDRILGRSSAVSGMYKGNAAGEHGEIDVVERTKFSSCSYPQHGLTEGSKSHYIQVSSSAAEMFAKPLKSKMEEEEKDKHNSVAAKAAERRDYPVSGYIDSSEQGDNSLGSGNRVNQTKNKEERDKGIGLSNNTNFVPFVPLSVNGHDGALTMPEIQEKVECKAGVSDHEAAVCPHPSSAGTSGRSSHDGNVYNDYLKPTRNPIHKPDDLPANNRESWKSESWQGSLPCMVGSIGSSTQENEKPNTSGASWNRGFSGKSLEGSAVKELDPLDMSEEAKAQRWFRRVAQIKDISELSQIPDEDFPQIMPMRKGVNRFVVSKRKTPLERRLTSPQYKRNLPVVNSAPEKREDESN